MATIVEHRPSTFVDFMSIIEAYQQAHSTAWYRGAGKADHALIPSLYRHPKQKTAAELHKLERDLALTFAQRSPPFVAQRFEDDWERMFYMQHYGIPTRLLDWSESPFIALYFALTSSSRNKKGKVDADAAVWLLNPSHWNKAALSDISFSGGILDTNREQVKSYSPLTDLEERKNMPVMIYGTHNSARIVAQRGMFSLFGKSLDSMDGSYQQSNMNNGILEKVIIEAKAVDAISDSLFRKGISDSTVYPDLHGLSLEMKRTFGF